VQLDPTGLSWEEIGWEPPGSTSHKPPVVSYPPHEDTWEPPQLPVPPCPPNNPGSTPGDGWCKGLNTAHPGSDECYRQYGPGGNGTEGNQCCYNAGGGLITEGPGAGSPDIFGPANGEDPCGDCKWGPASLPHFLFEFLPWKIGLID